MRQRHLLDECRQLETDTECVERRRFVEQYSSLLSAPAVSGGGRVGVMAAKAARNFPGMIRRQITERRTSLIIKDSSSPNITTLDRGDVYVCKPCQ